ncbi:MAG: polysaccharide biosynthesis protein [Deltaproteobacteria bacterium HGW-Deltaproteobacteria-2]|jgi:FlaA1/EpsC-like NDP-sugar epimerase|nr:MAG: polysaccharide biosynthesis protein [Deltaproteobacteria bacterium HGW-Deltaproteobacteria-2]
MYFPIKNPKMYLMIFSDVLIFTLSIVISYLFRFEFLLSPFYMQQIKMVLLWIIPLKIIVFVFSGVYRGMWRYTSIRDFWLLARACLLSTLLILAIILYISGFKGYSRSIYFMDGVFTFLLVGGKLIAIRSYYSGFANPRIKEELFPKVTYKNVLIIGAGDAGEKILREIFENNQLHYKVVGFIDEDPQKKGRSIHGVPVLGNLEKITSILEKEDVKEILIAIPSAKGDQIRNIVETCKDCDVSYKILPGMGELIDGRVSIKVLRDISYEDLLGRPPVKLDNTGISGYLNGRTVLITGCGGSIGSELCRQVIKYQPNYLVLLDASEMNLFNIQMELQNENNFHKCEAILGHVQNELLMEDIFKKYKPQIVFHAAAYKHVPMLERNPWEAVFNNIIGSRIVMEMSVKYHVERFVLVSTDKAVRPINVMGVSKRVTELIMQSLQGKNTLLMAVRFGNVIGSSGSVIPVFRRQIEKGGPVTVTHPEVNRYFMTIPESTQLVLQAAAMGRGGEIFILKMGTPVKIADMARDLIRLSGKEPDTDIKISYTGLRDGEKLYEELITEGEDILSTGHEKIMVLRSNDHANGLNQILNMKQKLDEDIEELVKYSLDHNAGTIKKKLREIVPEYIPQDNKTVL